MRHKIKLLTLCLSLFDGGSGTGAGDGTGSAAGAESGDTTSTATVAAPQKKGKSNPLANVVYGKQAETTIVPEPKPETKSTQAEPPVQEKPVDKNTEFRKLIQGDYKEAFDQYTQQIFDKRFKDHKTLEAKANALTPVLDMMAQRYGLNQDDLQGGKFDSLLKAIEDDESYYENEAIEKGLTVDQLKQQKKLERENSRLKQQMDENARRENANKLYQGWIQQAEEVKQIYPSFDFETAMTNQNFTDLLTKEVPLRTAFEVAYHDEIMSGALQFTATETAKRIAQGIASKANRPSENGVSAPSNSAVTVKKDVHQLTKADRAEILKRVERGEKISF